MADVKYHGSQRWTLYETFTDWIIGQIEELPDEVLKEVKITQLFQYLVEYQNYSTFLTSI